MSGYAKDPREVKADLPRARRNRHSHPLWPGDRPLVPEAQRRQAEIDQAVESLGA